MSSHETGHVQATPLPAHLSVRQIAAVPTARHASLCRTRAMALSDVVLLVRPAEIQSRDATQVRAIRVAPIATTKDAAYQDIRALAASVSTPLLRP